MTKKQIRENFRTVVFNRDGHKCRLCSSSSGKMDAHHITNRNDIPNGGYVLENGITLCSKCHLDVELDQTTQKLESDDLYEKINSSKKKALDASLKLKYN